MVVAGTKWGRRVRSLTGVDLGGLFKNGVLKKVGVGWDVRWAEVG